ncbi:hypothetical protein BD779DRAFT_1474298 [Infundibulicybe gibba]|nr:hypothetical protein BD779DRAFT_1474298 [Infundibulicybe gibba]
MARLSQRYTSQRLWYDDYTALFAVVVDCVFFVALHVWTRSTTFGKGMAFTFYWISAACFPLVTWFAKVSLALAIARIFPPGRTIRRFAIGMAWSFGFLCTLILLGVSISCGRDTSWYNSPEVQCDLPTPWASSHYASPFGFYAPPMLWRMKLPDEQRRLILAGFAASVWTSIAGGVCFVFAFGPNGQKTNRPLLGHAMASISLIVCNLMAVVAYLYRLVRSGEDLERSISEAASNNDVSSLPTVVLTNRRDLNGLGRNSYRRGISFNGYSFSEQGMAAFSPSSLFTTSRTISQTSGST